MVRYRSVLKTTKLQNMIFLLLLVFEMVIKTRKYEVVFSIMYAILGVSVTQLGSAQCISRIAFDKSEGIYVMVYILLMIINRG